MAANTKKKQRQNFFPSTPAETKQTHGIIENRFKYPPALQAQTKMQKVYLQKLRAQRHDILFAIGPAGTGKTFMAVRQAIEDYQKGDYDKIVITRPNVGAGDDLGFLPGDITEKMAPWTAPIKDVFLECFSAAEFRNMLASEVVEVVPLCFIRGRTFKNAIVIADEAQNCTPSQMKALLTRIGEGSRMIVTGDTDQYDRVEGGVSGLVDIVERFETKVAAKLLPGFITGNEEGELDVEEPRRYERIGMVRLGRSDVVRHPVIDDVLALYD